MITKRHSRIFFTILSAIFTFTLFLFVSSIYIDNFSLFMGSLTSSTKQQVTELETEKRLHQVKFGETLSDISKKYYGSSKYIETISEENKLPTDAQLEPGLRLVIPPFP